MRFNRRLSTLVRLQHMDNDRPASTPREDADSALRHLRGPSTKAHSVASQRLLEDGCREEMGHSLIFLDMYRSRTLARMEEALRSPTLHRMARQATHDNLSYRQRAFLQNLMEDSSITIKPADKNLGLVLMETEWYRDEMNRMLKDRSTYRPFNGSMRHEDGSTSACTFDKLPDKIKGKARELCQQHRDAIHAWAGFDATRTQQAMFFITNGIPTDKIRLPEIYLLPKVHKEPLKGRPIVPCSRWVTTPASRLADYLLQQVARKANIPWLVRDTKSFVRMVESTPLPIAVGLRAVFISADIVSLYTNIDTATGLRCVAEFLHLHGVPEPHIGFIIALLRLVMYNSYLSFEGKIYQQIFGTAMGTACAPVYANITIYMLERQTVSVMLSECRLLNYHRYLDDISALAKDVGAAQALMAHMNGLHPRIHFDFVITTERALFLDVELTKGERFRRTGLLDLNVYQKSMNLYLYIPWKSFHPPAAKRAFMLTELQRYIRNCSNAADYIQMKRVFYTRLRDRGYPSRFLTPVFNSIYYQDRDFFLGFRTDSHLARSLCLRRRASRPQASGIAPLTFVIPYSPLTQHLNTRSILLQHWELLRNAMGNGQLPPLVIAYRSQPSILQLLVYLKAAKAQRARAAALARQGRQPAARTTTTQTSLSSYWNAQ